MPDDISPEERLLRLIKNDSQSGDKKEIPSSVPDKPSVQKKASETESVKAVPRKAQKKTVKKKTVTENNEAVKPKPPEEVTKIEVFKEPIELVSGIDKKKQVPSLKKSDNEQQKKSSKASQKGQNKAESLPKEQAKPMQQLVGQSVLRDEQQKKKSKKTFSFITQIQWFFSGFNFFNYLLLAICVCVAGLTLWHIYHTPVLEINSPDIIFSAENERAEPESIGPVIKPFPHYIEQIGRKKLFKLVAPPPPPKPKAPARKKKEKPKIDIAKKTKHLVLQGIVYDIGPPQAIIFNKKENKTIFAGNDTVIGDIRVKEIKRGKIILEFEDQTQEMSF